MTISNRIRRTSAQTMSINIEDTQTLSKYYQKNIDDRYGDSDIEGHESLNQKLRFYIGDITQFNVDAIVCPVQTDLHQVPYGIHKQVLDKGGQFYKEKCHQVSHCEAGETFVTEGFNLDAKYIIHAAGLSPNSRCGPEEKIEVLKDSYKCCLEDVHSHQDIQSVAFPCLGCGGGGIELADAVNVAVTTIRKWMETGDHLNLINSIILVMYNEAQWEEYRKQLTQVFPYGKDLAGYDLETLESVPSDHLDKLVPTEAHSTPILCFRHKKQAQNAVIRHFHSVVDLLHKKVSRQSETVERYKRCAFFKATVNHRQHGVILFYGQKSRTVEVKVVSYSPNVNDLSITLCEQIQTLIGNYLLEHLDNNSTFKPCVRCELSNFGDKKGYIFTQELYECLQHSTTFSCKHRISGIHLVYPDKLLKYWSHSTLSSLQPYRQPVENDELSGAVGQQGGTSSWHSLRPESMAGLPPVMPANVPNVQTTLTGDQTRSHQTYQPLTPTLFDDGTNQSLTELKLSNINPVSSHVTHRPELPEHSIGQPQQSSSLPLNQREHCDLRQSNSCPAVCSNDSAKQKPQYRRNYSTTAPNITADDPYIDSIGASGGSTLVDDLSDIETNTSSLDELSDKKLLKIARVIGNKEDQLGLELGLPFSVVQRVKSENVNDAVMQAFHILRTWKIQQRGKASMDTLIDAMTECGIDTSFL